MAGITICFVRMRRSGGMDDDGEAVPPKNKVQAPIGKSKCEKKIICLYPPPPLKCNRPIFGVLPLHKK